MLDIDNLAHVDSPGYPHHIVDCALLVLVGSLVFPNMLLAMKADNYVLLDNVTAAVMLVNVMTTTSLCNANNVEYVAGKMSNGGDECLDGLGEKGRAWLCLCTRWGIFLCHVLRWTLCSGRDGHVDVLPNLQAEEASDRHFTHLLGGPAGEKGWEVSLFMLCFCQLCGQVV